MDNKGVIEDLTTPDRGEDHVEEPGTDAPGSSPTDIRRMAREDLGSPPRPRGSTDEPEEQADELPARGRKGSVGGGRTPLFAAAHAARYERQEIIEAYEELTGATLIVLIDAIFAPNVTLLEELLFDADPSRPIHLLLVTPGGDGETAIRMVRALQSRCSELTIIVPEMCKSAGTLLCLGADRILMGPFGDLGPVDPQFPLRGGLVSAKELIAAVEDAEQRTAMAPNTIPLFASLLSDVNMLMVQQARSALHRSESLVREALSCANGRTEQDAIDLSNRLLETLVAEADVHAAAVSADQARSLGLPVESADPNSPEWRLIWHLWTRYYQLNCWPNGGTAVYEGRRASQVQAPPPYGQIPPDQN